MRISQKELDQFVQSFNEDYFELLKLVSEGRFVGLEESFARLKDLYDVIKLMRERNRLEYNVKPLPFSIQDEFLRDKGFTDVEIAHINRFLINFSDYAGCDFEEFMSSTTSDKKKKTKLQRAKAKLQTTWRNRSSLRSFKPRRYILHPLVQIYQRG